MVAPPHAHTRDEPNPLWTRTQLTHSLTHLLSLLSLQRSASASNSTERHCRLAGALPFGVCARIGSGRTPTPVHTQKVRDANPVLEHGAAHSCTHSLTSVTSLTTASQDKKSKAGCGTRRVHGCTPALRQAPRIQVVQTPQPSCACASVWCGGGE
jgi:hypothetical protein